MFNNVIKVTMDLIKFKTVYSNYMEMAKCAHYLENYAKHNKLIYQQYINPKNEHPIVILSNKNKKKFDIMHLGHVDVVAGPDKMFTPVIDGNFLKGRGAYDMKAGVATGLELLKWVKQNNKNLSIGVVLSFDEEVPFAGSMKAVDKLGIDSKVILDCDVGVGISGIIEKTKNRVTIELETTEKIKNARHPWQGKNATDTMHDTISKIRQDFPLYSPENLPNTQKIFQSPKDFNKSVIRELYWCNSMTITSNYSTKDYDNNMDYAYTTLHFELIDGLTGKDVQRMIQPHLPKNTKSKIIHEIGTLNENRNNKYMRMYSRLIEDETKKPVKYSCGVIGGSNSVMITKGPETEVIIHSYNGSGMHGDNEKVNLKSVKKLCNIQQKFIDAYIQDKLSHQK